MLSVVLSKCLSKTVLLSVSSLSFVVPNVDSRAKPLITGVSKILEQLKPVLLISTT